MKKLFVLAFVAFLFASCEKETIMPENELPGEIINWVNTHFPETQILQAVRDKDEFDLSWKLILTGGYALEFNRKGEIIEIDGNSKLPDSVFAAGVLSYVNMRFPDQYITGWELDGRYQQVKLAGGLELYFTLKGEFLRIDS